MKAKIERITAIFGTIAILAICQAGCGNGGGNEFLGKWKTAYDGWEPGYFQNVMDITRNGQQFLLDYQLIAYTGHVYSEDKLVATYSDGKLSTTFPKIGQTSIIVDQKTGNLIVSGGLEFKKLTAEGLAILDKKKKDYEIRSQVHDAITVLDAAMYKYADEHHLQVGESITLDDLKKYLPNGEIPKDPTGGHFIVTKIGETPTESTGVKPF